MFEDGLDKEKNLCKTNKIIRHLSNSDVIKKGGFRRRETLYFHSK